MITKRANLNMNITEKKEKKKTFNITEVDFENTK